MQVFDLRKPDDLVHSEYIGEISNYSVESKTLACIIVRKTPGLGKAAQAPDFFNFFELHHHSASHRISLQSTLCLLPTLPLYPQDICGRQIPSIRLYQLRRLGINASYPHAINMSFLFGRQPQLSSEQKIAQAEAEIDMVSDMYSRFVNTAYLHIHCNLLLHNPRSPRPFPSPKRFPVLIVSRMFALFEIKPY